MGLTDYHFPAAEDYVIGAMLAHKDVRMEILSNLRAEDFYTETFRRIFTAVNQAGNEAEMLSGEMDVRELDLNGGDAEVARQYIASAPARSEWKHYVGLMHGAALTRGYGIELEHALHKANQEPGSETNISEHMEALESLLSGGTATGAKRISVASDEVIERSTHLFANQGVVGLRTGFPTIDRKLGGLQPGRNYVVGARAGAGKSTFVGTVALNVARQGKRVLVQSTEMSRADYLERMARAQAGISDRDWEQGHVDGFADAVREISKLDIHVDDYAAATPEMLRRNIIRLKPDLVVIDYLQRMALSASARTHSEYDRVTELSITIDRMKTTHSVSLLTVVQLNRNAEHREGNKPSIGDLRSSGQLEQDANVLLLLHRPSQYSEKADPDLMEVICPKNRHGEQDWLVRLTRAHGVNYLTEVRYAA